MAAENNNGSNGAEGQTRSGGERDGHTVSVDLKDAVGHPLSVRVNPRDTVHISGIDFHTAKVNILGPDMIITDPSLAKKLVLPGIGLFLFAPDEAPSFVFDDNSVTNDDLLARVGVVLNMVDKDYASFTNLVVDTQEKAQEIPQQQQAPIIIIADEEPAQPLVPLSTGQNLVNEIQQHDDLLSTILTAPPPPPNDPFSKPPSAHTTAEDVNVTVDQVQEISTSFSFVAHLLQIAEQDNTVAGVRTVLGGNGSTESTFDPTDTSQFSTQVIDTSSDNTNVTIYANDPAQISATEMTRIVSLSPILASGFTIPTLTISGLPAGFTISIPAGTSAGGTTITDNGDGSYTINNPTINASGEINLALQYTDLTPQTFTITMSMETAFNFSSGFPTPPLTNESYTSSIGVSVQTVNSAADYDSYTDPSGNPGWVLATNPNANIIHAGDGNNTIYGGLAANSITVGNGNNVIYDGTGTAGDAVTTGNGNNLIYSGGGNETITGGTGVNTVNYDSLAGAIYVDLGTVSGGFSTATVGGKTDLLQNVQNVLGDNDAGTTTFNNYFAGNAANNLFVGGTGNNTFVASMGDDTLQGTQGGNNTLDYSRIGQGVTIDINDAAVTIDAGDIDQISYMKNVVGTAYADTIVGLLTGGSNLDGGGGNNTILAAGGSNTINGGAGGVNTIDYVDSAQAVVVNLTAAADVNGYIHVTAPGQTDDLIENIDNIIGSNHDDSLVGSDSTQFITGGNGDSTIIAGDNGETLTVGSGNNSITGGTGNDTINLGAGSNTVAGNGGTDTLSYAGLASAITLEINDGETSKSGGNTDIFTGITDFITSSVADTIYGASAGNSANITFSASDNLYTAEGGSDSVSTGGTSHNTLIGSSGSDTWSDADGNANVFEPGTGNTTITGSNTNDRLDYSYYSTLVSSGILLDIDTHITTKEGGATDNFSTSSSFVYFVGTNNGDTIIGAPSNNTNTTIQMGNGDNIYTNVGSRDTVIGGTGSDTYIGSTGNETWIDSTGAADLYKAGAGALMISGHAGDTLDYSAVTTGSAMLHIDTGTVTRGSVTDDFTGVNNFILLNSVFGTVYGAAFGESATVIQTTSGSGTAGAPIYYAMGGDNVFLVSGGVHELSYANDTVTGPGITVSLNKPDIEQNTGYGELTEINFNRLVGSAGNDSLTSGAGGATIWGGGGNDTYVGVGGPDAFIASVGGTNLFRPGAGSTTITGAGTDTLDYSTFTAAMGSITLHIDTSTTTKAGSKTDTFTGVTNFVGTNNGDTIYGPTSTETAGYTVHLGSGNNAFHNLGGADTVIGSTGADTYYGNSGTEVWIDTAGGGANVFKPVGGPVSITGGTGDTLDMSGTVDAVTLHVDTGVATVSVLGTLYHFNSAITYFIGTNDGDTIYGAASGNTADITLGSGSNKYTGEGGNDTVIGNSAHDTYIGGTGSDTWTDSSGGANLYEPGTGAVSITGSGGDTLNYFSSLSGPITINIAAGTTTKDGGTVTDHFSGISGFFGTYANNTYFGAAAGDTASITFGGGGNIYTAEGGNDGVGTGGGKNNTMIGSTGNDTWSDGGGSNVFRPGTGNTSITGVTSDTLDYSYYSTLVGTGITLHIDTGTTTKASGKADSFSGIGTFIGTNNGDSIFGATSVEGAVAIQMGTGNNIFTNEGANDTIDGNIGNDTYIGGTGAESWIDTGGTNIYKPSTGAVSITGSAADTIDFSGLSAAITLHVDLGAATITGGATDHFSGVSNFIGTNEGDTIYGAATGNSAVIGLGSGSNVYYAVGGNNTVTGSSGGNIYIGNGDTAGNEVWIDTVGSSRNYFYPDLGYTTIEGSGGDALNFSVRGSSAIVLHIDTGTATWVSNGHTVTFSGISGYGGTNFGDTIYGAASGESDTITLGSGNNSFTSEGGTDTVTGGSGNDTYVASGGGTEVWVDTLGTNDFLLKPGAVIVTITGSGNDTLDFSARTTAIVLHIDTGISTKAGTVNTTFAGIENFIGTNEGDTIYGAASGKTADIMLGSGNNTYTASGGNDTVIGSTGNDTYTGGTGNDVWTDTGGTNLFKPNSGATTITGGAGDTLSYASLTTSNITLNIAAGTADKNSFNTFDHFSGMTNFVGTNEGDTITGAASGKTANITLGTGNNSYTGAGGDDTVTGSTGKDTYTGSNSSGTDVWIDTQGGANQFNVLNGAVSVTGHAGDTLNFGVTNIGGGLVLHIDTGIATHTGVTDYFTGMNNFGGAANSTTVYGSTSGDTVTGGSDTVALGSGSDVFYTMGGNDVVTEWTAGTNTLSYVNDTVTGTGVNVSLALTTAQTTTFGTITLTQSGTIETLIGGSGNDTLTANATGNDSLNGGLGNDTLISGSSGNDTLTDTLGANDFKIMGGNTTVTGSGNDTLDFSSAPGGVTLHIDTLSATFSGGSSSFTGVDSFVLVGIHNSTVYGPDLGVSDTVTGGDGANTFFVNGGNDYLNLIGTGNTLSYADDTVTGTGVIVNLGLTTPQSTGHGTLTLPTGSFGQLVGSSGDDTLTANNAGDTINGGAGNNVLTGGSGNDFFYVTVDSNNTINGAGGSNWVVFQNVVTSFTVNLASGSATVDGSYSDSITNVETISDQTSRNNVLIGDGNNNLIQGGSGSDTIDGGGGNDTIAIGGGSHSNVIIGEESGSDTITLWDGANTGTTTLDYQSFTDSLTVHLDTGIITKNGGTDDVTGIGTQNLNVEGSSSADNAFYANGTGRDTMQGGAGEDTFHAADTTSGAGGNVFIGGGTPGDSTLTYDAVTNGGLTPGSTPINGTSGSITRPSGAVDSFSNIGNLVGTEQNDSFSLNTSALLSFTSINGGGGSDTVSVVDTLTGDANVTLQLSSIFSDIGTIDLHQLTLAGDNFTTDFTGSEVLAILGGTAADPLNGGTLNLVLHSGSALANSLNFADDSTFTHVTLGNTTTFTDSSGHTIKLVETFA